MSDEPRVPSSLALSAPPDEDADYNSICSTLAESARGRWFLAEYARRNRHADTQVLLAAIERIESALGGERVPLPVDRLRDELAELASAVVRLKVEIDDIRPDGAPHGKILELDEVVQLVRDLGGRIDALIELSARTAPAAEPPLPVHPVETAAPEPVAEREPESPVVDSAAGTRQAEMPLAASDADVWAGSIPLPVVSFVGLPQHARLSGDEARPECDGQTSTLLPPVFELHADAPAGVRAEPDKPEVIVQSATTDSQPEISATAPAAAASDPLADVMALSEEEKIALFS